MKNLNSLQAVCDALLTKYSKLEGYTAQVSDDKVIGGFYKMNYNGTASGQYFFHETFGRLYSTVDTFDKLFSYLDANIQKQLSFQKKCDQDYATEFGKEVAYKYDYSLID